MKATLSSSSFVFICLLGRKVGAKTTFSWGVNRLKEHDCRYFALRDVSKVVIVKNEWLTSEERLAAV